MERKMSLNDRLAAVFEEVFHLEGGRFTPDIAPEDVPQWDSLGHMALVMKLEEQFDVHFEVDDITEMSSAAKIVDILKAKGIGE
jgi:acyl carrier protein